jgi:hypothetical protein
MFPILAAATNDLTSGSLAEKIAVVLTWPAVFWALGFTFFWDLVELWVRGLHFKFFRTQTFWIYFVFHAVLSVLATIALGKTVNTPWLIGLLAAISTEMILSNANITFGTANILPLLDLFKKLRVVMQQKIDDISKSATAELIEKLSALPLAKLEEKLIALLIQSGKQPKEINQQLADLKADCAGNNKMLATKLANDFIQLDPEGAKRAAP